MAYTSGSPWDQNTTTPSSHPMRRHNMTDGRPNMRMNPQPKPLIQPSHTPAARATSQHRFSISCQMPDDQMLNFDHITPRDLGLSEIICRFARGTLIKTSQGSVAIEDLKPGDLVQTKDNKIQPVRWIASCAFDQNNCAKQPRSPALRISSGALGYLRPEQDLVVSSQFRVLINNPNCAALFGTAEALAPVANMLDGESIMQLHTSADMEFYNLMFDSHQIITANGLETESYHPGNFGVATMPYEVQSHLKAVFPQLNGDLLNFGPPARSVLKGFEADILNYGG